MTPLFFEPVEGLLFWTIGALVLGFIAWFCHLMVAASEGFTGHIHTNIFTALAVVSIAFIAWTMETGETGKARITEALTESGVTVIDLNLENHQIFHGQVVTEDGLEIIIGVANLGEGALSYSTTPLQ